MATLSPTLVYPLELRSLSFRPSIVFSTNLGEATDGMRSVSMPAPNNIAFADSASYNNAELGIKGKLAMDATKTAMGGKPIDAVTGAIKSAIGGASAGKMSALALALTDASSAGEGIKSGVSIGVGATLNKNITTEFTGVGTREFSFVFKFISSSQDETQEVSKIFRLFRQGLYPKGDLYQLKYPPKWQINFYANGKQIQDIPKIFPCYLKDMTSTYNAGSNTWRPDGSPLESDLTLTFVETRALTLDDIKKLEDEDGYTDAKFAVTPPRALPSPLVPTPAPPAPATTLDNQVI